LQQVRKDRPSPVFSFIRASPDIACGPHRKPPGGRSILPAKLAGHGIPGGKAAHAAFLDSIGADR
jgi:hypothetical protein